jgi:pimeloyl-ACP methyl ester carboxylesterase
MLGALASVVGCSPPSPNYDAREAMATEFSIDHAGVVLSGEEAGAGPAVILLHGLTASRRYVVMGSKALERGGYRVISYDARAHGRSSGAPDGAYNYDLLGEDLLAVMDGLDIKSAVLAGASMGAHTLLNFTLRHPERVDGIVVITPAYSGDRVLEERRLPYWDRLAEGLRAGGVEGFVEAYGNPHVANDRIANTILTVIRQRLSMHEHPEALADAIQAIPRSRPFGGLDELEALDVPTAVVVSSDEADPEHPERIGRAYADTIPGARLVLDPPGSSPIAWQGSQLSRVISEVAEAAASRSGRSD